MRILSVIGKLVRGVRAGKPEAAMSACRVEFAETEGVISRQAEPQARARKKARRAGK